MALDAFSWSIIRCVYSVIAPTAVVGICLNAILLLTTWKTKSLRCTSNILIGFCALCDIAHHIGYLIQLPILFSDYYIDSFTCSFMQFIPQLGLTAGAFCVLSIGTDRMLTAFVLKNFHSVKYHLMIIALFACWTAYLMIAYWTPKRLICSMPSPFHGDALGLFSQSLHVVNGLSVVVYFCMWRIVEKRRVSEHSRNVFISIAVVMIFEVTGWFIYSTLINLSQIIAEPEHRPPFHYVACMFVNFSIAVKTPVYYVISSEYRRAIRAYLGLHKPTSVVISFSTMTTVIHKQPI